MRAGRDTILGHVERAKPVDILAELIWNALDAEAMNVETTVTLGALGAPEEIIVRDDGHGMPPDRIHDLFLTHGESWKRVTGFSPTINRPLHGQLGRGRFLTYGIAERVEWRSVSAGGDPHNEAVVQGNRNSPNEFTFDGPWPSSAPIGTTVRMQARQTSRVTSMAENTIQMPLTARLAASLLALPEVTVTYCGRPLNPQEHIVRDVDLEMDVDPAALHGTSSPRLRVVEWSDDMRSRTLYLCDDRGGVVTEHQPGRLPPAPIHWTAYLQWEGFRDPTFMGPGDLQVPDLRHPELLAAAHRTLAGYLKRRLGEQKGSILNRWKAEGVYPYQGEPGSAAEEVEREVFDIVAVVASRAIGRDAKQKKLSLQLLREATRADPARTNRILNAVLDLSSDEQKVLVDLLEHTKLASVVRTARTVADRSDALRGLRRALYANESKTVVRDVDHLHPMLVNEPWIFGDEWSLAVSETELTLLVRTVVAARDDVEFAPHPVVLPPDRRGRVDMVFSRHLPGSERTRHLVVELTRPKRLTMTEFDRINGYAAAITSHPEVQDHPHDWDFWLVGTDIDAVVRRQYSDPSRPGLTTNDLRYRIWVVTWEQLLDHADRQVQAFRSTLELLSTDDASRAYLQRKHAEFIPLPNAGDQQE